MENQWKRKCQTKNVRSLSIKLRDFRSQEKTTRTILMILGARKTRDHACSHESKIIQIVRLSKKLDAVEKMQKKTFVLAGYLDIRYFYHNGNHIPVLTFVDELGNFVFEILTLCKKSHFSIISKSDHQLFLKI